MVPNSKKRHTASVVGLGCRHCQFLQLLLLKRELGSGGFVTGLLAQSNVLDAVTFALYEFGSPSIVLKLIIIKGREALDVRVAVVVCVTRAKFVMRWIIADIAGGWPGVVPLRGLIGAHACPACLFVDFVLIEELGFEGVDSVGPSVDNPGGIFRR